MFSFSYVFMYSFSDSIDTLILNKNEEHKVHEATQTDFVSLEDAEFQTESEEIIFYVEEINRDFSTRGVQTPSS